jgi:hypothetical protein
MSSFKIDTFESKPQQTHTIDISSSTGLAALKKNDAFMYYSIPAAREAEGFKKGIETSKVGSRLDSAPTKVKVTRQRRISVERHQDEGMEDLIYEMMTTLKMGRNKSRADKESHAESKEDIFLALFEDQFDI